MDGPPPTRRRAAGPGFRVHSALRLMGRGCDDGGQGMVEHAPPRLLIFVIAYQAEATLAEVLDRIPRSVFDDWDCEILVVDDASTRPHLRHRASLPGGAPRADRSPSSATPTTRGTAGTRRSATPTPSPRASTWWRWSTATGSTPRRSCPDCSQPLREGDADAVFGSRMMARFGALKGGMPLYKFVGNKILTTFQNAVLGTQLSEFHSGYRLYRVADAAPDSASAQLQRLPLRHRDHPPAPERRRRASSSCPFPPTTATRSPA